MYDLEMMPDPPLLSARQLQQRLNSLRPLLQGHIVTLRPDYPLLDAFAVRLLRRLGELLEADDLLRSQEQRL